MRYGGREPREIEGHAPNKRGAISGRRRRDFLRGDTGEDECVDGVGDGRGGRAERGYGGTSRGDVGPVFAPNCALSDPAAEEVFLGSGEGFVGIGCGHDFLGVMAKDAGDEFAVLGFAGDDGCEAGLAAGEGFRVTVETEAGLARGCVGAVTVVTVVGKDRLDIAAEIDGSSGGVGREHEGAAERDNEGKRAGNPGAENRHR